MTKVTDTTTLIAREEGYREKPYYCTEGYPTIGIGLRIGPKNAPLELYEIEFTLAESMVMLGTRIRKIEDALELDSYCMNNTRRAVLISLAYQVGISGSLKFKRMWMHIRGKNWDDAAMEYLDSKAARQTPARFARGAEALRSGKFTVYNK